MKQAHAGGGALVTRKGLYLDTSLVNDKTVPLELWAAIQTHFEGMGLTAATVLVAKIRSWLTGESHTWMTSYCA